VGNAISQISVVEKDLPGRARAYAAIKAIFERFAAALLILLASPLMAVLALLIKRGSRGPVFYSQIRLGRHGRHFRIWKLRTMRHDCEKVTGPVWATANDARVTGIGRILRDTHLDEVPQLWNILRGEMSLIGPRPERPEIAARIEPAVPGFHRRLQVKPGVTGLAQLHLPPDTEVAQVARKLSYDLYYVRNQSLRLDVGILLSTAFHFLAAGSACISRFLLAGVSARPAVPLQTAQRDFHVESSPEPADLAVELRAAA
jgi:lipopolysaccharide/colanic/teichoic acid biosynthesis glycosyltransferase